MSEEQKAFENKESTEPTPRPNLLDVVKIDGRWAQTILGGECVRYLDDDSKVFINWDDFIFVKDWKTLPVWKVKESTSFTKKELRQIHWGPEQEKHPYLREAVRVFGEFEKRDRK